jgi:hypothetical protein
MLRKQHNTAVASFTAANQLYGVQDMDLAEGANENSLVLVLEYSLQLNTTLAFYSHQVS